MSKNWIERIHATLNLHDYLDVEAAEQSITKNVHFRGMNVWILACAIIIASIGLNVNSTAVIIGAMLISPLMGPIIGFGLSLGTNNISLLKTSLYNLLVMVLISIAASALFFLISPLNMQNPSELLARTTPTIYDVLVAFFGGAAGALETSRKDKGTVISGVAIATALMPPLCTVGYGLANLKFQFVAGAFYLFFINCIFVALATFIVVKYLRFPMVHESDPVKARRMKYGVTVLLIIVIVPSVISAVSVVKENNFNMRAAHFVEENKAMDGIIIYDYKTDPHSSRPTITLRLAGRALAPVEREHLIQTAQLSCGIGRDQVIIEESAFVKNVEEGSEFEKQVYNDLNTQVSELKARLHEFESEVLPYEQLRSEILALYPSLTAVELAKGESCIFAVVTYAEESAEPVGGMLAEWLKVRLGKPSVTVIENHQTNQ